VDGSGERRVRRSLRDWLVDIGLFLGAAVFGLLVAEARVNLPGPPADPAWLFTADQLTGALAVMAVWLRRRWPVGLTLVLTAVSTYSELAGGALVVGLFTVAIHRPVRTTMAVFAASLVSGVAFNVIRPEPGTPPLVTFVLGTVILATAVGWGLFIRHRRQLVLSLRERAARAEEEAELRAEQAQLKAREAIAREMHDVLGHRLSLLSVHAGALEYHTGASPEETARAAKVIRESAHQALQDLREVIGVLRAPVGELPQPTAADIEHLVAESAAAGMPVTLSTELAGTVPDTAGRTAYRIVQEGLTNVRKHAPDAAEVRVRVSGAPGEELVVEVTNTAGARTGVPKDGQGLIGLRERVTAAGGRLEYGAPGAAGGWRLRAWIPWPS
jgi:signal transduction histidine kinase